MDDLFAHSDWDGTLSDDVADPEPELSPEEQEQEQEFLRQQADELNAISDMLRIGNECGLQVELISSYTSYIRNGDSVREAALAAIYDWDAG